MLVIDDCLRCEAIAKALVHFYYLFCFFLNGYIIKYIKPC